ncbi:hypothetical protein PMI42_00712 [Bradyrhizobium sp. YR681]|uniref:hypothetical protein n=1 Tax=Bradyrhizobium sp. YR681 TaxID=1144344 RepID=UPI000270E685|nr:hypothetical protein [Bradyrhizobium sp. YR681]EJN15695.1 hypothetical protein PMI42_00712 [Bradyrhizobium sp. YR681]
MKAIRFALALACALPAGQALAASTCNVKEYNAVGYSWDHIALQVAQEPALTDQSPVDFTSGEAKSAAFNASTSLIEIICNAQAAYLIGANPTATANNSWVPAGVSKFIGVKPSDKISFITKP